MVVVVGVVIVVVAICSRSSGGGGVGSHSGIKIPHISSMFLFEDGLLYRPSFQLKVLTDKVRQFMQKNVNNENLMSIGNLTKGLTIDDVKKIASEAFK